MGDFVLSHAEEESADTNDSTTIDQSVDISPNAKTGSDRDRTHFVLDTNVLLHNPGSIFKFAEHEVVIPLTVIEELDGFKKNNDETGRNSRQVIRDLDHLRSKGRLFEGVAWNENGGSVRIHRCDRERNFSLDLDIADNRILGVAHELHEAGLRTVFISKDINARVKCDALDIPAEDFEHDRVDADWLHAGWIQMIVPGGLIDDLYDERQIQVERLEGHPATTPDGSKIENPALLPNLFMMLVDENDPSHTGLARLLADTGHVIPVTGPRKPVQGVMARNLQQKMALDLLLDDDVKLLTMIGPAGSGKTLLALACGLQKVIKEERYDKLLTARPIMPLGRDIGYLPGDKDEKLAMWMQPIFDNLAYLLSTRGNQFNDAESRTAEQRLDQLLATGRVVLEPITYIRGRSIPHQFIIVDEAQNLSPHEVRTIVSRVGEGTKIVLCGDIGQIDSPYLDSSSNGLSYVIERMKAHPIAGHVTLERTERSELASIAAEIL
ncbi:MAG: phosphate starvation-inducible protein PhoH [Phycisphaerae bacterium]|nr:phosphate starvation-inducible protein PhoH [Phycisphaerae bacterium]